MGAIVLFIVTAAFMISGAAVLYPLQSEFKGWSLLTEQRHVWSNIHGSLIWVCYIAIIAALWGTLQAFPEIYARVSQELFQAIWPHRKWNYATIRRYVSGCILVTTFVIIWLNVPFDILTQIAGFVLANLSIALIMLGALYLNFELPAAYRTRLPMLLGAVVSAAILVIFAGISGWGLLASCWEPVRPSDGQGVGAARSTAVGARCYAAPHEPPQHHPHHHRPAALRHGGRARLPPRRHAAPGRPGA